MGCRLYSYASTVLRIHSRWDPVLHPPNVSIARPSTLCHHLVSSCFTTAIPKGTGGSVACESIRSSGKGQPATLDNGKWPDRVAERLSTWIIEKARGKKNGKEAGLHQLAQDLELRFVWKNQQRLTKLHKSTCEKEQVSLEHWLARCLSKKSELSIFHWQCCTYCQSHCPDWSIDHSHFCSCWWEIDRRKMLRVDVSTASYHFIKVIQVLK